MDITELYTAKKHDAGAEICIKNPETGEDTDCFITVIGVDSKKFRTGQRKRQRKALEAIRGNKEIPEDEFGLLADSIISWRGFSLDGKEWPCNKKNALTLFDNSPLIADQVDKFIADRSNFTTG